MKVKVLAIAFVVVTLGVTGCGDDDADTLTASEYRAEASAVCERFDPEITALFIALDGKGETVTPEDLQATVDGLVRLASNEIDEIESLTPPDELASDVTVMLAAAREAIDVTEAQGIGFFEDDSNPFAAVDQMAAELGIDGCVGE